VISSVEQKPFMSYGAVSTKNEVDPLTIAQPVPSSARVDSAPSHLRFEMVWHNLYSMLPTATSDLIAAAGDRLTPTERRIAAAVLAEPTLLVFGTVTDLASRVDTSPPSIVRFANKLGFKGYTELQQYTRSRLSQPLIRPSDRIRHHDPTTMQARAALEEAIATVFEATDGERLAALAAPIVHANKVWIISGETVKVGAHALHGGISMIRPDVHLVEAHSMGTQLSAAGPGDAAVILDFFRYRRQTIRAAHILAELGVEIVAITDGPLSPLAALADIWCILRVPAIGPFDSAVPVVAMAEFLVASIATQLNADAIERIDRTEEIWAATDAFLPDD